MSTIDVKRLQPEKGNDANINCYWLSVVKRRAWEEMGTGHSHTAIVLTSPQGLSISMLITFFSVSLFHMFEHFFPQ